MRERGIELRVEDGALRFRAPKGAFTPELRAQAQANKTELLAFLQQPSSSETARGASSPESRIPGPESQVDAGIPRVDRAAPMRMSFGQERIWFLYRLEGPSSTYNITPVYRLRGPLSLPALTEAFDTLVRRHETLRMRFSEVDGVGMQIVDPPSAVTIDLRPLLSVPEALRMEEAERIILEETARPFELERGGLLRVTVIALGQDDHILLPFMHHIIADGWSLGVLQRELIVAYEALAAGQLPTLDPLPVQYPDFAAWQRHAQQDEGGRTRLDWWRRELTGAPQTLALPLDGERPPVLTFNGRVLRRKIPEGTVQAVTACGRANRCSLFMTLLAAYGVLLHRHSGQDDILVGSPVAGRPLRELEGVIGCFVNTVVLRIRLDDDPSFVELLQRVRRTALDAYSRQDVPVEAVIDAVLAARDPGRNPLYQTQFSLQNVPVKSGEASSVRVEAMPMDRVAAKNDLLFILEQRAGEGIDAELEYNTDLFREDTVRALGDDYVRLLEDLVAAPEARISTLPIARRAPAALRRAEPPVQSASGTDLPNERFHDLVSGFDASAARNPGRIAVRDADGELTYAQLNQRADRVADRLLALDLTGESPVGLLVGRSVDLIAGILGTLKAGGAYLPLSADHPAERLRFMLTHAGARVLITDLANEPAARVLAADGSLSVVVIDDRIQSGPPASVGFTRRPVTASQLAYIIFTSGSTGRPKGVMIEHGSVVNLAHALHDLVYRDLEGVEGGANVALVASAVFDASVQQIFPALLYGHTLCLVSDEVKRDGERLSELLRDWRIAVCDCTPSLLGIMLRGGLADRCGGSLRHLLVGGEPLSTDLLRELYASPAAAGIVVTNVYGPTECCVDNVALSIQHASRLDAATMPIGRPMRNCRAIVVDRHDAPVAAGVSGELLIAGVCVGRGYVNDPGLTAERFTTLPALGPWRFYRTGDLCRVTADGLIEFVGRTDDQVKILGYRIELGEVESHLRAHPAIRDVTVHARLTSKGYRELAAYVVSSGNVSVADLRAFAAARMPAYMIPAYFVALDALPLNSSGKVARTALPDPETAIKMPSGTTFQAARTDAERALLEVWKRTLKLETAGVRDNYFASGGDSIKALQLAARLREAGWRVEVRDIFQYPTIEQLSSHLEVSRPSTVEALLPDVGIAPLSAIQRFFFETYGASPQFNQALLLRPVRPLTFDRLRSALSALSAHHGMLRCRFARNKSGWVQEVLAADAIQPIVEAVDLRRSANAIGDLHAHAAATQARFQLDRAPLWSATLFDMPDGQRLLLTAHHLIIDGVSWRILLDDLERVLDEGAGDRPVTLPARSAVYAEWVAHQRRAADMSLRSDLDYWRAREPVQPGTEPERRGRQADRSIVRTMLSEDVTGILLTAAHRAYSTEINDLLIAAIARAWCAWTGEPRCALTIEGHGRESLGGDIDLSRTIGWFTSIYPVTIELPPAAAGSPIGAAIKHVKETLRSIPNKGAGYAILRYMTDEAPNMALLPPLAFNYLGRFDTAGDGWFERAPEDPPPTASPDLPVPWPLEITAAVVEGRMECALTYSGGRFDRAAAQSFLDRFKAELEGVVQHTMSRADTEVTASDLDYTGLTDQGLDDFLSTL